MGTRHERFTFLVAVGAPSWCDSLFSEDMAEERPDPAAGTILNYSMENRECPHEIVAYSVTIGFAIVRKP